MSMSIEQAKAIVQSTGGQTYQQGGSATTADTGYNTGGGGSAGTKGYIPPGYVIDPNTDYLVPNYGVGPQGPDQSIAPGQTIYLNGAWWIYDPAVGGLRIPTSSEINNAQPNNGNHPTTVSYGGDLYQWVQDPNTGQWTLAPLLSGSDGGGGSSSANLQAQLGYDYANLAENRRQFDIQQQLAQQQANQGYVQNRATTGLNLGDLVRNLANDQYQRALNPGNYPAYLAASAGLPQGTSSPIDALLGQGVQISAPAGGNPLADPRFQQLLDQEYGYAQPQGLQTVQNIAAQNGGQLPQSFYDYTHTQNPNVPAHASGGTQMLHEPVIGIGLHSGMPKFLAGEAGPERLDFTPVHQHESQGMPVPHAHAQGDVQHDHTGPNAQPTFKGYAMGGTATAGQNIDDVYGGGYGSFTPHQLISAYNAYHPNAQMADNVYTPAEGTNISIGKQLQTLGYVPQSVVQQYLNGTTATPASFSEDWFARLPASIQQLMQAGIQAQLGTAGLEDFNQRLQQFQMPTSIGTRTGVAYQ